LADYIYQIGCSKFSAHSKSVPLYCHLRQAASEEWKLVPNRATFEPDYGRRGKLWVHGAFEPATGQTTILMSPGRDSASHIQLLEQVIRQFPSDRWL
jgi:hypothetical protein